MYQRARLGVGYLPQENSIFRGMSVWDNVMAVAELTEKLPRQAQGADRIPAGGAADRAAGQAERQLAFRR
jgi:ABC-type lipopolysaccharide export system ATPase subunit